MRSSSTGVSSADRADARLARGGAEPWQTPRATTTAACCSSVPTACSTSASGDGGGGGDPGATRQRPEPRHAARQDPAHRPARRRRRPYRIPRRQPVRRAAPARRRDLGLRTAQPVAVLVRPPDGRPVDRRRRPERRSRRSTSSRARQGPGRELRLARRRGHRALRPRRGGAPARRARLRRYPHADGHCSITGGYVVPRPAVPGLRGPLRLRRLLPHACGPRDAGRRARAHSGLETAELASFGEDAQGRIYALSLDGPVYRLVER